MSVKSFGTLCRPLQFFSFVLGCFLGLSNGSLQASPIQVYECLAFVGAGPLPTDSLEFNYTIRRHVVETEPVGEIATSIWSEAKFENNGTFEIDVYEISGAMHTEHATSMRSTILDGQGVVRDELMDEALSTENKVVIEGFVIEDFSIVLTRNDGTAFDTHLKYPDVTDLSSFDQAQCFVRWRVPNGGVVCQVLGGGSTICTHGTYRGNVRSISTLPHEEDHGSAFSLNAGLNDAWVNDDAELQGLFITVYPDLNIVFMSWFTFDSVPPSSNAIAAFGAPDQRWVTAVGTITGNIVEMKAELTTGGAFHSAVPNPVQDTEYGTIRLEFSGCKAGKVNFDFPSVGESGEFNIRRVVESNVGICESLAAP
ncbi:MAG: hypothetical protein ACI9H8_000502 [Lysobacterales bacterium]|jgi:hypothetical protein